MLCMYVPTLKLLHHVSQFGSKTHNNLQHVNLTLLDTSQMPRAHYRLALYSKWTSKCLMVPPPIERGLHEK